MCQKMKNQHGTALEIQRKITLKPCWLVYCNEDVYLTHSNGILQNLMSTLEKIYLTLIFSKFSKLKFLERSGRLFVAGSRLSRVEIKSSSALSISDLKITELFTRLLFFKMQQKYY